MQRNLTLFVLLGLILGVGVGYWLHSQQPSEAWPEIASNFKLITDVFLRLIKMIIAPLVFGTLIAGIALARRATIATRNTGHFDGLDVPVVNPWGS